MNATLRSTRLMQHVSKTMNRTVITIMSAVAANNKTNRKEI
jgi:hypothetical protein